QLGKVKPKYVLLLGNVPLASVLELKGIKKLRGKPIERDGVIYLPTYHPSYIMREPKQEETFESDIRFFAEIVNNGGIPREEGLNYHVVNDEDMVEEMLKDLYGQVAYDIETTTLYPWLPEARINSLGFGTRKNQWCVPTHEWVNKEGYDKKDYGLPK